VEKLERAGPRANELDKAALRFALDAIDPGGLERAEKREEAASGKSGPRCQRRQSSQRISVAVRRSATAAVLVPDARRNPASRDSPANDRR